MTTHTFDITIVGSGPGGYVAAIRAGQLGRKVAVVERDAGRFGGTCLHRGCIPTKVLLHAAAQMRRLPELRKYGIEVGDVKFDWAQLMSHKDRILKRLNGGTGMLLKKNKAQVFTGRGVLKGGTTVAVDGQSIQSKAVVLATGSEARSLPGIEIDGRVVITNVEALELDALPKSMLVIGAGAVGIEFASLFAAFGVKVTVVEMLPRIVPFEDEEISAELEKLLKKRGIDIRTNAKVEALKVGKGGAEATVGTEKIKVEKVLVAVGRKPNTEGVGLETTKAKVERGYVITDEYLRTGEPGLYAIGDITTTPQLAHVASAEGIVAVEHASGHPTKPVKKERIPSVTFCDPQVASVGLTEAKAREAGKDVVVGKFPFQAIGKALVVDEPEGFVKVVADRKYGEVLGVHILHAHAGDLIGEAVAALAGELTAEDLAHAMHPHPTLGEALMEAAHAATGKPIHL